MNRYQHPAEMIVKRFTEKGIDSVMTGECGAIIAQAGPGGISVDAWRQSNKVIWDHTETDRRCRKVAIGLPENPAL